MRASAIHPVQVALYGVLHGDATFMSLVTGLFDSRQNDQLHPYAVIGGGIAYPRDTLGKYITRVDSDFTVWSSSDTMAEVTAILDRAVGLLHRKQDLVVVGFSCGGVLVQPIQVTAGEEDAGVARRGALRVTTWVEQVSA